MAEEVSGSVFPGLFAVCETKLFIQGIPNGLHNDQPDTQGEEGPESHQESIFVTERVVVGEMRVLCLHQPVMKFS